MSKSCYLVKLHNWCGDKDVIAGVYDNKEGADKLINEFVEKHFNDKLFSLVEVFEMNKMSQCNTLYIKKGEAKAFGK
jgi:hypothetical protein